MNCEKFNDQLPEFLDETLSAAEQAAAREHVQNCVACRQALAREEALAKSIRLSFDLETQNLSLSAETRQSILKAWKQRELGRASAWERLREWCTIHPWKPALAGLVFFCCVLLFISGSRLLPPQPPARGSGEIYIIDVPMQAEVHLYRRQGNRVVDALVTGATVINASFLESPNSTTSLKRHAGKN